MKEKGRKEGKKKEREGRREKREIWTEERHGKDGYVKTEAENGVRQLQAKDHLWLLGATMSWKRQGWILS